MHIPLHSLVAARQSGVAVQPGAFQQTANASASLLSSVNGASQAIKKHFDQAEDYKNRSEISEGKRQIREAQGAFQNRLAQDNVPPHLWGKGWQEELIRIQSGLGLNSSETSPVVKRALGEAFNQFSGTSFIQISGAALKENKKRARQNFDRDYQFNAQNGNHAGNDALVEENRDLLGDDFANDTLRTNKLMQRKDDIEFSRNADPFSHVARVKENEWGLSKVQQQRELEVTDREIQRAEAESLKGFRELEEAGLIDGEEDLKSQLESDPAISKTSAKAYLRNYKSNQPLPESDQFSLQDKVDDLQQYRGDPEKYESEWMKVQTEVNSYGNRKGVGRFNADLHNVRPGLFTQERADRAQADQRADDLKPIQSVANALVKERASGLASIGFLQQKIASPENADDLVGNANLKKDLEEHEILLRSALQSEANQFIHSFPADQKPTAEDVKNFIDKNGDKINLGVLNRLAAAESNPFGVPTQGAGGSVLPALEKTEAEKAADAANIWLNGVGEVVPPVPALPPRAVPPALPDPKNLPTR